MILPIRSAADADAPDRVLDAPPIDPPSTLRVMRGPQDDYFDDDAMTAFFDQPYRVAPALDRMGARLTGARLIHARPERGHDLASDGLVPGAIQVPASGEPIILGPDCQTVGGYPKIATVIQADLHLIGRLRPSQTIEFAEVRRQDARQAAATLQASLLQLERQIADHKEGFDLRALYEANLVDGVVSATAESADPAIT